MKKSSIYFLAALLIEMLADTALINGVIWLAIVLFVAFIACAVRLIVVNDRHEDQLERQYYKTQRDLSALYKYLEDNRLMTAEEIAEVKEDKPRRNVRPGSRPSVEYLNMKLEQEAEHDVGAEDPKSA